MRLGKFGGSGDCYLKKGDEFRISTNKKILGDNSIVSCDCEDLGKIVTVNDKLLIDYGRIAFNIKR